MRLSPASADARELGARALGQKGQVRLQAPGRGRKGVPTFFSDRYNGLSKSVERETAPEMMLLGTLPLGSAAVPLPHPTGWRAAPYPARAPGPP